MAITLTQTASKRMDKFLTNRKQGLGVRLGVQTTGCSGLGYTMEFVDDINDDDSVFEDKGVKIIIDAKSLVFLDGTEVDFVKEGLNEGFEFNNPNSKAECGCGESFTV
jgi:iron-sulfur cluster assembly protein